MKTETIVRIVAMLVLSICLGFIIWQVCGFNYALISTPFIFIITVVTEFDEIFKTE